jgi:hypothetical protein
MPTHNNSHYIKEKVKKKMKTTQIHLVQVVYGKNGINKNKDYI